MPLPSLKLRLPRDGLAWFQGSWLAAAVCWSVAIRVPLIVNAAVHLDSDLAVNGLTLLQAVQGRWRWHYPGTPHMGIAPVMLSWVQARLWGTSALTLVSGGTVAYVLVLLTTFALAWRVYGRAVAVWSLVPLCFASTGTLWLSGRITGGHLPVLAWSAAAWLLLHGVLVRPGPARLALLGLWCGLGIYLDSMFLMTLAGMLFAGLAGAWLAVKQAGGASAVFARLAYARRPPPKTSPPFAKGTAEAGDHAVTTPPPPLRKGGRIESLAFPFPPCEGGGGRGWSGRRNASEDRSRADVDLDRPGRVSQGLSMVLALVTGFLRGRLASMDRQAG